MLHIKLARFTDKLLQLRFKAPHQRHKAIFLQEQQRRFGLQCAQSFVITSTSNLSNSGQAPYEVGLHMVADFI